MLGLTFSSKLDWGSYISRYQEDNQEEYGNAAGETLRKNFYEDDLLKSVNTSEFASKLIDDVRQMCKAGGFHLTKFICNDKEVLAMIPEEDRRQGVKN